MTTVEQRDGTMTKYINWLLWQVGMIAVGQDCPKVNLQYENRAGLLDVLALVKKALPAENDGHADLTPLGQRQIAFQVGVKRNSSCSSRHCIKQFFS